MGKGFKKALLVTVVGLSTLLYSSDAQAEMFGKGEISSEDTSQFTKWNGVVERHEQTLKDLNNTEIKEWEQDIALFKDLSTTRQKIEAVNNYVNARIEYRPDIEIWGKSDYWASIAETLSKGYGDCDDYAIAKYFTLKEVGFSEDDMRIVVLKDHNIDQIHAVLSVNINGTIYILDNQSPYLRTDRQITYYEPIYSINEKSWWRAV
jgi:predicted transglutaminase-like cysteine proteinase